MINFIIIHPSLWSPNVSYSAPSSYPPPMAPPFSFFCFLIPETISSILISMQAHSIEVLNVYCFTAIGSQISASLMLAIFPVFPSIPK